MAIRRLGADCKELVGLTPQEAKFVTEYVKDYNARRAAKSAGYSADHGYALLEKPGIAAALQHITMQALDACHIDAQWVLMEAVDNHLISRQMGNISASNTALRMIMNHSQVDAVASNKVDVEVTTDAAVHERLARGRHRARMQSQQDTPPTDEPLSFF